MIFLLTRFFMKPIFLPVQIVADINEVDANNIKLIYHKNKDDERFKIVDGKLHVMENYRYPFAEQLDELRQKALIVSHNENNLCVELSKMTGIKKTTLNKYFYRFTFKQIKQAKLLINALKTYIHQNSLFPVEELNYDY